MPHRKCHRCGAEQVRLEASDIPLLWELSLTQSDKELSERFEVSATSIRDILRLRTWRKVSLQVPKALRDEVDAARLRRGNHLPTS